MSALAELRVCTKRIAIVGLGQLTVRHYGSGSHATTSILADVNGDGHADMKIRLSGHVNLARGDFIL